MIWISHLLFGVLWALIVAVILKLTADVMLLGVAVAVLGALLPDVDEPKSLFGGLFLPLAALLEHFFGHRTVTHSLLGAGVAAVLATAIVAVFLKGTPFLLTFASFFLLGWISHLFADALTPWGVPVFYPFQKKNIRIAAVPSGSAQEFVFFTIPTFLALVLVIFYLYY